MNDTDLIDAIMRQRMRTALACPWVFISERGLAHARQVLGDIEADAALAEREAVLDRTLWSAPAPSACYGIAYWAGVGPQPARAYQCPKCGETGWTNAWDLKDGESWVHHCGGVVEFLPQPDVTVETRHD